MANKQKSNDGPVGNQGSTKLITCPACSKTSRANVNLCPACSYVFGPRDRRDLTTGGPPRILPDGSSAYSRKYSRLSQTNFVEEMAERGFKFVRHVDGFTGELVREENDPQLEKLGLQFERIPARAEGVYITQTHPQIQVSMPFDTYLELVGIRPE